MTNNKLGRITFVALNGDLPDLALDVLPASTSVAAIIHSAFAPFLVEGGDFVMLDRLVSVEPPQIGLHLVYAYGHAWLGPSGPQTGTYSDTGTMVEEGAKFLARLVPAAAANRTILVLDCCHAAAFDSAIVTPCVPRLVIYGSAAEEKAIAFTGEQATRLSLAIEDKLSGRNKSIDLAKVFAEVAEQLDGDGVLRGQTVTYRMSGLGIRLSRGHASVERRRGRTEKIVRNVLLTIGAVLALTLLALSWFYRNHSLIELNFTGLHNIAQDVRLIASEEDPTTNNSLIFADQSIATNSTRLWVPASNVIMRVQAVYSDGAPRALAFHLNLKPSLDPTAKSLKLSLPSVAEVKSHPNMAFVPATSWYHGRERDLRTNTQPFWIDIRPPTVQEYWRVANALLQTGQLDQENSFVLSWRQRSAATDAVGLEKLPILNKDLGAILGAIEAGTSPRVAAPSDIVVGLGKLPCDSCPAPMTRHEAELFCKSRNLRLPTDLEWELAVRGVDGRVYPWGNRFDESRANVPGLPEKEAPSPALKPVHAYKDQFSPFGLIDTVGNAGDWVLNETSSYEHVYMGATYRYNPEDATAFRLLPVTDSDYLIREITARCVAAAK